MTTHQQKLQRLLRQIRHNADLSQQELANRLGKPQSFVSKYESGERRLDILELWQICKQCDTDFIKFAVMLEDALKEHNASTS